jgi:protocatechuate 3,4-dioxygenase beta subunit
VVEALVGRPDSDVAARKDTRMTIKLSPVSQDVDSPGSTSAQLISRRVILRRMGTALAAVPVLPLLACNSSSSNDDASSGTDTGTSSDAGSTGWATGGTAAMKDKASYPNPFSSGAPTACALSCAMTQGPCYSSQSETIQDISYGMDGLPMRMYLQIVDESCNPVSGALVDVWHVSPAGKYSGNDSANENVAYCTGNDSDYTSHVYFRGKQTTDAKGVVFFDGCFPGWYSGRTVHIHFAISVGGQAYVTTQLFFDDTLTDVIVASQPIYDARGARDTTNQNDGVISASAVSDYLLSTQKMTDGAMLSWKTIVLRTSLSESLCTAPAGTMLGGGPGGGGPGEDGGPPPDRG